jgi:glycolate oxidase iron-sulfur subunit
MMFHGAQDQAFENIQTNVRALAAHDCDAVIVDCTTCGAALKDEYPRLIDRMLDQNVDRPIDRPFDSTSRVHKTATKKKPDKVSSLTNLAAEARQIADKTVDILSFLGSHIEELKFKPQEDCPKRAAYHAPCHSRNSFHTLDRVRALLKKLPTIDYVATPGEADCCGGGGTFFYEHPDIAEVMIHGKVDQIRSAWVDLWLTDCPVCRINLAGNLDENDPIRVVHPVTIIHKSLGTGHQDFLAI